MSTSDSYLNLAFSSDAHYYNGLETAVASAIVSSQENTQVFNIFIVDGGILEDQQQQLREHTNQLAKTYQISVKIHWLEIGEVNRAKLKSLKGSATYYARILLPELIEGHDWVLWIDSDILCLKDLSDIGSYLKKDTLAAGVIDLGIPTLADEGSQTDRLNTRGYDLSTPYINTGFCLMNLNLWRKENITDQLIEWGKANGAFTRYHDQAMINWELADQLSYLPPSYNVLVKTWKMTGQDFELPAVLHFTGPPKPWDFKLKLSLKYSLRNLRIICATHVYHRFRAQSLEVYDRKQLEMLLEVSRAMLRQLSSKRSKLLCTWKCLSYQMTGKHRQLKHWSVARDFYRNHAHNGSKKLETIIPEIEQWLST